MEFKVFIYIFTFTKMASVRFNLSKFVKYFNRLIISNQNTKNYRRNNLIQLQILRKLKKKHFFFVPGLCGVIGENEIKKNQNIAEEVLHNVALATIALKDGNLEKSGDMLLKSLDLAEKNNFLLGVVSTCDLLSSLAVKLGDYDKAETLLRKALTSLLNQGTPEDDNHVVSFNLKLSRIYSNKGNDELAELGFKKCLKTQEKKLNNHQDQGTFLLWSSILYWYGKFLLGKSRFQEAKNCFKNCFLTSEKLNDLLPSQIMVILYNLGDVCEILGEHDEAIEHLLKGVSIDKNCQNPDLSYFYSKLGNIFMCKGLYEEAKVWCEQAQKFATKYHNSDAEKESNECLQKLNAIFVT